jgi:type IV pilus assembly protein PilE
MQINNQETRSRSRIIQGFTLIEVMVVVAIVAILAAVAYPSYVNYIIRANRSAAQSFMLEVASRQERYLLDARQYAQNLLPTDPQPTLGMTPPQSVSANYTITNPIVVTAGPPPNYTITATPIGNQLAKDTLCGTLTINSTGTKTASGSGGVAQCWKQ